MLEVVSVQKSGFSRIQISYSAALLPLDSSKAAAHSVFVANVVAKPAPHVIARAGMIQIPRNEIMKILQEGVFSGKYIYFRANQHTFKNAQGHTYVVSRNRNPSRRRPEDDRGKRQYVTCMSLTALGIRKGHCVGEPFASNGKEGNKHDHGRNESHSKIKSVKFSSSGKKPLPLIVVHIFKAPSSNQPTNNSHNHDSPTSWQYVLAEDIQSLTAENASQNTKDKFSQDVQSRHDHCPIIPENISTIDQCTETVSFPENGTICRDSRAECAESPSNTDRLCEGEVESEIAKRASCKGTERETAGSPNRAILN